MDFKFYLCPVCGNIICKVVDSGVTPVCCGSEMILIEPKSVDSHMEKHLPTIERLGDCSLKVKIGAVRHPTSKEHHIQMIALRLKDGIIIKPLSYEWGEAPVTVFHCAKGDAVGIYSYCNLHGMWYLSLEE